MINDKSDLPVLVSKPKMTPQQMKEMLAQIKNYRTVKMCLEEKRKYQYVIDDDLNPKAKFKVTARNTPSLTPIKVIDGPTDKIKLRPELKN